VIEIAELVGVPVPVTRAIDASMRLKTALRDRAAEGEPAGAGAATNGRRTG
jgi:hypothetical protein